MRRIGCTAAVRPAELGKAVSPFPSLSPGFWGAVTPGDIPGTNSSLPTAPPARGCASPEGNRGSIPVLELLGHISPFSPVPQVLIPGRSPLLTPSAGSTAADPAARDPAAMSTFRQESVEDFYEMGEELGR